VGKVWQIIILIAMGGGENFLFPGTGFLGMEEIRATFSRLAQDQKLNYGTLVMAKS